MNKLRMILTLVASIVCAVLCGEDENGAERDSKNSPRGQRRR